MLQKPKVAILNSYGGFKSVKNEKANANCLGLKKVNELQQYKRMKIKGIKESDLHNIC